MGSEYLMQILAFQVFHGEERLAFVFTVFIYGDNVFVTETTGYLGFVAKPAQYVRSAAGEDFDCNFSFNQGVVRTVDTSKSTAPEFTQYLISADLPGIFLGHGFRSFAPLFRGI
jgi:hypothetical protein